MKSICVMLLFTVTLLGGCASAFVDVGAGYTRFNLDEPIRSVNVIDNQPVETKITHVDGFIVKARTGTSPIEAIPQLRTGIEFRGGIGAGRDVERVDDEQLAFSKLLLLMLGGGPFISWKQPFGDYFFLEAGAFAGGYTVGVHETGRKNDGVFFDVEDEGGVGYSGGVFAKVGVPPGKDMPMGFGAEFSYELGRWEFGGDVDNVDVENFSILLSSEVKF